MFYGDKKIDRAALIARSENLIMTWSRAALPKNTVDGKSSSRLPVVLITGFGSFTQNEHGEPQANVTQKLLTKIQQGQFTKNSLPFLPEVNLTIAVSQTDWLAPIRIHRIAERIKPDLIINLGQGGLGPQGTCIESGALNAVGSKRDEYDEEGKVLGHLKIVNDRICDRADAPLTLPLSWTPLVTSVAPNLLADGARKENTYICNATAWTIAASIAGISLDLFAGTFKLAPLDPKTIHGFLHLPQATAENLESEIDVSGGINLTEALAKACLKTPNLS